MQAMRNDSEAIVEGFYAAWRIGDVAAAMAYCHDDIRVTLHYHDYALPFSGHSIGSVEARRRLEQVASSWEFLDFKHQVTSVEATRVRTTSPFTMRHRGTGMILSGTFRHVWTLHAGRIIGFDGYTDIAMLKSFLRMIGLPAAAQQP
jgi:ketosteroid isomerase-like protein